MDDAGSLDRFAVVLALLLYIIVPPIVMYLAVMTDTLSTIVSMKLGGVEANPLYHDLNKKGLTPDFEFKRHVMAFIASVMLFIVGVHLFYVMASGEIDGVRYEVLLVLLPLVVLMLSEVIVTYENLHVILKEVMLSCKQQPLPHQVTLR